MDRKPLYYTFGNHMHWVDMQWLWGYEVLPGCVADMKRLIDETGARGCVNFDGIGYEKMAAESPEALAELRAMIEAGVVEPVSCSYGQPYGLFHPGESNVRQFTHGVRTARRLLGVRPRTFWEEEFYFFPQLPQILKRCGYSGASLFFQWTWHTPELPKEETSLILWEGVDGSRLPALPRNALNVHQWPEDFDGLLEQGLVRELDLPAIVQWLELMPSKDWMCRSEVLLPRLKELMKDERFEVRPRTCEQLIGELTRAFGIGATSRDSEAAVSPENTSRVPIRCYTPDDAWHGMTLGKNADRHPRTSRQVERRILAAESISALAGLLGRPYPSWDVYPTWELDEAWRELLAAQHHDNHECEGLCGFVGYQQMNKARQIADEVTGRTAAHLEDRSHCPVSVNVLGWRRRAACQRPGDEGERGERHWLDLLPFGYAQASGGTEPVARCSLRKSGDVWTMRRGNFSVDVDVALGRVLQVRSQASPDGVLADHQPLLDLRQIVEGRTWTMPKVESVEFDEQEGQLNLWLRPDQLREDEIPRIGTEVANRSVLISIRVPPDGRSLDVSLVGVDRWTRPDGGMVSSLRMPVAPKHGISEIRCDTPYAIGVVHGSARVSRKYPTGDWMTSPQRFEYEVGTVCAHSLIDLLDQQGRGLLVVHNGSQQWFRRDGGVEVVLNAYDPWDERRYEPDPCGVSSFRLIPHERLRDVDRVRLAHEFAADDPTDALRNEHGRRSTAGRPVGGGGSPEDHPIPPVFAPVEIAGDDNILCHALYRDSMKAGEHLPDWAGHEMARRSDGRCTHPYVLRLVEWDGEPGMAILKFAGEVAAAAKTNLMGEVGSHVGGGEDTGWLEPEPCDPPKWAASLEISARWNQVCVPMKPREIATVMVDLVLGRKQWRDLDAKREVWATVHKKGSDHEGSEARAGEPALGSRKGDA